MGKLRPHLLVLTCRIPSAQQLTLRIVDHEVVSQHQRDHRLRHGDRTRYHTRIVPAPCQQVDLLVVPVDRLLLPGNGLSFSKRQNT